MQFVSESAINAAPTYNETEVRFHIIDPILRALGYPGAENVYLFLEERLRYPYYHVGRRSEKDLPLGFADYRAGLKDSRGSFIVEAKAGNVPIGDKDVEQAHSYAAHAQVGANYFVLCNGIVLSIFETLSGPKQAAIVELPIADLKSRFHEIENILSPTNLEKNCKVAYDKKLKLADGLASSVRVRSGRYDVSDVKVRAMSNGRDCTEVLRRAIPQIAELDRHLAHLIKVFEMRVSDGYAKRNDDGKIVAHLKFSGVTLYNHEAMKIFGIDEVTFFTSDKYISTDEGSPTIFDSINEFRVPRGTLLPELYGNPIAVGENMYGSMFIKAAMYYRKGVISGNYVAFSFYRSDVPGFAMITFESDMAGTFELKLDD